LILLGAVTVGKALKTPAVLAIEIPVDQSTVGTGLPQQPLTKADRLEIATMRQEAPVEAALQPVDPPIPPAPTSAPPVKTKIISRHWHAPDATAPSAAKSRPSARMATNRKGKSVDPKRGLAADRSKPADQVKPCNRTGAFGDLLRSMNLSPACAS
jgi:hypothetical protein